MALIECPECGKSISDKADACIHCGYPVARYQPEQGEAEAEADPEVMEPAVPAQPGEKADRVRRYNARLAITAFIGTTGSLVLSLLSNMIINVNIGSGALAGMTIGNSVISLLGRPLIILLIIAFFCQKKVWNYIALGWEAMAAILLIASPAALMKVFGANTDIFTYGIGYLRMTGIIWIVAAGLCVLLGYVIRRKKMMLFFILLGSTRVLALLLVLVFMLGFGMGIIGAAFGNIAQPFTLLLPLLLFNRKEEMMGYTGDREV